MPNFIFKELGFDEIAKIREIDRAEEIFKMYKFENGQLLLYPDYQLVDGFTLEEINQIIQRQERLLSENGKIMGVFSDKVLIGVASLESKKRGIEKEYCKMDILYVSKDFRGLKIAQQLLDWTKKEAIRFGAKKLYISATPTQNTVDFYLNNGAKITQELDNELFTLEPEDIHLEISLF